MSEANLSEVTPSKEPKQERETQSQKWQWVEHTVWTERMLRSLERGIFDEAGLFNLTTARAMGR